MELKGKVAAVAVGMVAHGVFADGSAQNEYVRVSCGGQRIVVKNAAGRHNFNVFAPGYIDSFVASVFVEPVDDWNLVEPRRAELPLRMKGGDDERYKVKKPPEDRIGGGTIYFHNYWIKSDQNNGDKTSRFHLERMSRIRREKMIPPVQATGLSRMCRSLIRLALCSIDHGGMSWIGSSLRLRRRT